MLTSVDPLDTLSGLSDVLESIIDWELSYNPRSKLLAELFHERLASIA